MHNSIRRRLTLVFIGLAIGPLLLVGVILAWQSFITQEQQALNLQREVAQHVSSQVKAFFDGLENELRLVSQVQGLQKLDRDKQRNILAELLSYQDAFESLVLLDSQGQEQVHVARSSISLIEPGARAKADEFVIPQTSGLAYCSPVHFDEITGEPFVTIAVPLYDVRTGLVNGVLVSEVRFERIWDLIMNLRTSPGQSVYIVDTQNKVVAHRNPSVVLRGTTFHVPDQDGIQPGLASVSPMLAVDMREGLSIQSLVARLTSPNVVLTVDTVRFGEQEFNIIAEQTVAEALALAITTILITVSLIVAALVISVALGLVIVRQVVQPIQAMATTAQAISAGDLSRQVQVTSRDEVGVLAAAFNSMTTQLRQSLKSLEQQVVEVKQAEESLRRANETLQALIDYSPLAITMLDLDSHVLLWNNAAEKMYGWTAQEALGEFIPFVPEDKREEQRAIHEHVTKGEIFTNLELERRRKDGSKIFISASVAPLRDSTGSVYAHMSIATDITERKKAEQALRESEERLGQIASSLREVIWLRDVQTRQVLYVNSAFEELTGRTCESFYENRDLVIDATHPDDKEWVIKALDQRFEGVPFDKKHRIIHLDGSVRWVSSRSFPVRNEAGEVYRWASIMEDITERKQAEEALAEERNLLRTLIDNLPDLIYVKDTQGRFVLANRATAQFMGASSPSELIGKTDFGYYLPELALQFYTDEQAIVRSGQPLINKDEPNVDHAGNQRWLLSTKTPLRGREGEITGIVGIGHDVTERKQAEEALREAEIKYRTLVEQIPAVTYMDAIDEVSSAIFMSPQVQVLSGYSPDEWKADPELWAKLLHPDDRPRMLAENARTNTTGEPFKLEYRLIARDGRIVWVHDEAVIVRDSAGRPRFWQGVMLDITERKRAEDEVKKLNQDLERRTRGLAALNKADQIMASTLELDVLLRLVMEQAKSLLDVEAASVLLHTAVLGQGGDELVFAAATGSTSEKLLGTRLPITAGVAGWVMREKQPALVADAQSDLRFDNRIDATTGMTTCSLLAVPLLFQDTTQGVLEAVNKAIGTFDQHDLEMLEALASSAAIAIENARLYQAQRESLRRLQESQTQLVQAEKMAALGRLVASLAHEINNPLQAVQNSLELAGEELEGSLHRDKLARYLGMANSEIERLAAIVRRMRDFYRPAQEGLRATDVNAVLQSVLELAGKQLQHSHITVEREWSADLPMIRANPDYLKQVFLNLVLNAIDAMAASPGEGSQGGTLWLRTTLDQVPAADNQSLPAVRIEFEDTGEGIPPDLLPHIFEPFTTTKTTGTGLGLSISYRLIEAHKGRITVTSQVGVGTTFTIFLPMGEPQV